MVVCFSTTLRQPPGRLTEEEGGTRVNERKTLPAVQPAYILMPADICEIR